MSRFSLAFVFLVTSVCSSAQDGWQAEVMPAIAVYRGDLSQGAFSLKSIGPGAVVNIKYDNGDLVAVRAGLGWGRLAADDKNNKKADIRTRNLDFKSTIYEFNVSAEVNLLDPEMYHAFPYLLVGAGVFHFNPYTYDKDNKKTMLRPLSTEGEGLPEYPDRKKYSLTQFYLPIGGGWKMNMKDRYGLSFEIAVRYLFTDYLDDVSKTYINNDVLLNRKGPKAVELANRQVPKAPEGDMRGNSETKDFYFMAGVKYVWYFNRPKDKK